MTNEVRSTLENLYNLCDSIDELPGSVKDLSDGKLSLRKSLYLDISHFIMYLSASDGHVSQTEACFLSDLMGGSITPDEIYELIKEHDIYSTKFESEVPLTLKFVVKADNMLVDAGRPLEKPSCDLLIQFFEAAGKLFCESDGVAGNEHEDLAIYMRTMRNFVQNEYKGFAQKSYTGGNSLKAKYEILKKN